MHCKHKSIFIRNTLNVNKQYEMAPSVIYISYTELLNLASKYIRWYNFFIVFLAGKRDEKSLTVVMPVLFAFGKFIPRE